LNASSSLVKRKDAALFRLGIEPEELEAAPKITELLQRTFGTKTVPRLQILDYLRASGTPSARKYLQTWKQIPLDDRDRLSIEAICVAAEISPLEILGAVLIAAKSLKAQESALKAILSHPEITDATIKAATTGSPIIVGGKPVLDGDGNPVLVGHGDLKAQEMMHHAVGFLPTKGGQSINIDLGLGRPSGPNLDRDDDEEKAFEESFPQISGKLETWSDNRRLLADGK
jgi:hypothetical protein